MKIDVTGKYSKFIINYLFYFLFSEDYGKYIFDPVIVSMYFKILVMDSSILLLLSCFTYIQILSIGK